MVSRKITLLTRLSLVILILSGHIPNAAANAPPLALQDRVYITDFDEYRKINYKDQQLLIYTIKGVKSVFYLSKKISQNYTEVADRKEWAFQVDSKNRKHKITLKNGKIGYYSIAKSIYYNSVCSMNIIENIFSEIDDVTYTGVIKKIKAGNFNNILDSTCSNNEDFTEAFNMVIGAEKLSLTQCYDSIKNLIQQSLPEDKAYLNYFGNVYSRYYRFMDELKNGKKPLTISCDLKKPDRIGSFDERVTDPNVPKISFNLDLIMKNAKTKETLKKEDIIDNITDTLRHELFHYGQPVQGSTQEESECINEAFTQIFSNVCNQAKVKNLNEANTSTTKEITKFEKEYKPPTSKEISESCKQKNQNNIGYTSSLAATTNIRVTDSSTIPGGTTDTLSKIQAQNKQASQQLVAQTEKNLQNTVTAVDYASITNDTFAKLAGAATVGTTQGREYSVSADSDFGKTTVATMRSFNDSGRSLSMKLNSSTLAAAAALSGNSAVAATKATETTKEVTSTNTKSRNPASTSPTPATTNSKLSTSQMAAKTSENTSANSSSTTESIATGAGSGLQATTNATATIAGTTNATTTTTNTPATEGTVAAIASANQNQPHRQPASNTQPQQNPRTNTSQNTITIGTVRALENFTSISGPTYQTLSDYYRGDQQKQENLRKILSQNNIKIKYTDNKGKQQEIGATNPKKVFNDTGKGLVSIENKP